MLSVNEALCGELQRLADGEFHRTEGRKNIVRVTTGGSKSATMSAIMSTEASATWTDARPWGQKLDTELPDPGWGMAGLALPAARSGISWEVASMSMHLHAECLWWASRLGWQGGPGPWPSLALVGSTNNAWLAPRSKLLCRRQSARHP